MKLRLAELIMHRLWFPIGYESIHEILHPQIHKIGTLHCVGKGELEDMFLRTAPEADVKAKWESMQGLMANGRE